MPIAVPPPGADEWTDTITAPPLGIHGGPRVWRRLHGGVANSTAYQMWISAVGLPPQDNTFYVHTYARRIPVGMRPAKSAGLVGGRLVLVAVYLPGMSSSVEASRYGEVFDEVAEAYDRHRPTYPDALIDRACEVGGLGRGAPVLEIGCGTGQLTQSLLARGLRVTAIEPGERLIARARDQVGDAGEVEFVNRRLEEASLPRGHYAAVFSASAIHWVDPKVGWGTTADALVDGGTLALISYFGLEEPRSASDQQALRAAMARVTPELAAEWPTYRDLDGTLRGVRERRGNVSEVWAWLGSCALARRYAASLFDDTQVAAAPTLLEHTADALNALLGTMSFWPRLSARQREALCAENHALQHRLGRPIRSSTVACLVTARRVQRT